MELKWMIPSMSRSNLNSSAEKAVRSFVWVAVPDSEPVTTGHLEAYLNKKRHRASVVNCEDKDALMGLEGVPAGDHDLRLKLVDGGGRTRAQQRIQVKARGP
mmetsp:Transcript_36572/g.79044  ORF Transcript_36572/g.79044 Transcript_36572/m.79044 type:complete len:102 (+) Transcript_36572:99-404(+)